MRKNTTLAVLCSILVLAACQDNSVTEPAPQAAVVTAAAESDQNPTPQLKQRQRASAGVQYASQLGNPVPASMIVSHNGLEWVYAAPCAHNGCSGVLVGKDGFRYATVAEWALRPPIAAFNGKCAAPWFATVYDHCDFGDAYAGYLGSAPAFGTGPVESNGGTFRMHPAAETWLVRGAVDATPPSITANVVGTLGNNGWYTSDVAVSWTVTDGDSPISSQTGCTASSVTANTAGVTFTCSATSAGGSASQSVTIKRDATVPVVTYAGNAGTYEVDANVAITCAATDDLSGVASSTCANISGAAYTFALGNNSFSASATDNAGNQGSGSTAFTVTVSAASLCNLTKQFVSHNGIANSLCVKLNAAAAAAARGNTNAKQNQLGAYINEVQAQAGKAVSAANAATLAALANALM